MPREGISVRKILLSAVLILLAGGLFALFRRSRPGRPPGISPDDVRDMQGRVAGTYRLENAADQGPTIVLQAGGVEMTHIPTVWLRDWVKPGAETHTLQGDWSLADDGDGSWVIDIRIRTIDTAPVVKSLRARPGDDRLYFDDVDGMRFPNMIRIQAINQEGK